MVIFGATAILTKRKLIPALCNLATIICFQTIRHHWFRVQRSQQPTASENANEEVPKYAPAQIDLKSWDWFKERIYYVKGDFPDPEAYKRLAQQIDGRQQGAQ